MTAGRFDDLDLAVLGTRKSEKWHTYAADVLPAWVAEMDFPLAEPIERVLQRAVDSWDVGYPISPRDTGLCEAFCERMQARFDWSIEPRRVEILSEVVQGMYIAVEAFSVPGEGVVVQTPIYPPFLGAVADTGRRLVEYRLPSRTPWPASKFSRPSCPRWAREGEDVLAERVAPLAHATIPFTWHGRRFLVVAGRGSFAPSCLVLLEALGPETLKERLVFWNFGHMGTVLVEPPHIVFVGWANDLGPIGKRRTPNSMATFHLDDVIDGAPDGRPVAGTSPEPDGPLTCATFAFRHFLCLSTDLDDANYTWRSLAIREGVIRSPARSVADNVLSASTRSGLEYLVDLGDGHVRVRASQAYRQDYGRRRRESPGLPDLDRHLRDLQEWVTAWRRG